MKRVVEWARRATSQWTTRRDGADATRALARSAARAVTMTPIPKLPRPRDDVLWPRGQAALERHAAALAEGRFEWLQRSADFSSSIRWHDPEASPLWLEQLHSLSAVADLARTGRLPQAVKVLSSWRSQFERRWDAVAWSREATSQRIGNLCVAAACAGGFPALGGGADRLVATHAAHLAEDTDRETGGHGLIETGRALLWAARAFRGGIAPECDRLARSILSAQLARQVLPDGGHFELSPMYHCVVMRSLCEIGELLPAGDPLLSGHVAPTLRRMGEFLGAIVCPDGDIPLLGESVRNFGPPPAVLLALISQAPAQFEGVRSFPESGLHVLRQPRVWAILDAGPVAQARTPAHAQADTLTVEVWVDGVLVVCDPGACDASGPDAVWIRSSRAHSTMTVEDRDTSKLAPVAGSVSDASAACRVTSVAIAEGGDEVVATIVPAGETGTLSRSLRLYGNSLTIEDRPRGVAGIVRSRLHLNPAIEFQDVTADGQTVGAISRVADIETGGRPVRTEPGWIAPEYGRRFASRILVQEVRGEGQRMLWVIGPA